MATLLGHDPPALERCRVLELGCADGRNLLPMAAALPEAEFVGVDLSARQIENGQAIVAELGLAHALALRKQRAGPEANPTQSAYRAGTTRKLPKRRNQRPIQIRVNRSAMP